MKKIAVLGTIHPDALALIETRADISAILVENPEAPPSEVAPAIAGANGIVVRSAILDAEMLSKANGLEVVSRHGVGCDNIDVDWLSARRVPMAIATGANTQSVIEHVFALMLGLARQIVMQDAGVQRADWTVRGRVRTRELRDKTLLIVGCGRIGSRIAPLAQAFGMQVLACDPYVDSFPDGVEPVALKDGLERADVVTLHTPLNAETRGLISARELGQLSPGVILINCARGGIADEAAVAAALRDGRLGGYGVDVFTSEPIAADNPLLGAPNLMMSPHSAALTPEAMRRMGMMAVQNVLDCFDGRLSPDNVFNSRELGL